LHKNRFNGVISTSMGRLFDAVSAVLGICRQSTFEGQAAQALQGVAEAWLATQSQNDETGAVKAEMLKTENLKADSCLQMTAKSGSAQDAASPYFLPTDILFREILQRKLNGEAAGALAYYFHQALADMTVALCGRLAEENGIRKVALSGGVFQNTLLLGLMKDRLTENGLEVLHHHLIPPNDGGLSLGQALYGLGQMDL
ncbi:MAG: carbamoyltransferase HypF, partial [Lachnospiraceae bacterium]|nr:carbamoyltransferase HypF [Candidatus Equihabitans merdae]